MTTTDPTPAPERSMPDKIAGFRIRNENDLVYLNWREYVEWGLREDSFTPDQAEALAAAIKAHAAAARKRGEG